MDVDGIKKYLLNIGVEYDDFITSEFLRKSEKEGVDMELLMQSFGEFVKALKQQEKPLDGTATSVLKTEHFLNKDVLINGSLFVLTLINKFVKSKSNSSL